MTDTKLDAKEKEFLNKNQPNRTRTPPESEQIWLSRRLIESPSATISPADSRIRYAVPFQIGSLLHSSIYLDTCQKTASTHALQFRSKYIFFAPVMTAFLNQRLKQCSNHPSYTVRAVHQISTIPFWANTINILSHYAIFFSTGTPPSVLLSFSFLKNRSIPPLPRFQANFFLVTRAHHPPSTMASFSEIPQVQRPISSVTITIPDPKTHHTIAFFLSRILES